jgi:hypothetical protein
MVRSVQGVNRSQSNGFFTLLGVYELCHAFILQIDSITAFGSFQLLTEAAMLEKRSRDTDKGFDILRLDAPGQNLLKMRLKEQVNAQH